MQQSNFNNLQYQNPYPQQTSPNAVSINIYSPQAYGGAQNSAMQNPINGFYSMYGQNMQPNLPLYPANYNNPSLNQNAQIPPQINNTNTNTNTNMIPSSSENNVQTKDETTKTDEKKDEEKKTITPLTDDYVKSLENYLNDPNPKVRLIGAKELLERFKEDENRKDNPSLIPLLNKALQDNSPTVRFLALTMLQLDYCVGDDLTVQLLKQIEQENKDKVGEDQLLAKEILLKMAAPEKIDASGKEAA